MATSSKLAVELQSMLQLSKPPVAISFRVADVSGLEKSTDKAPSSCTFWTKATDKTFYTTPEQHNAKDVCSIGAVTHGYKLAKDAEPGCGCEDVDLLASVGWITGENIGSLPTLPRNPERKIAYGPLAQAPFEPDVVMMFCKPEQAMLMAEAAPAGKYEVHGKPTCQCLPEAFTGKMVIGLGCIASRLRAGYDPNELFVAVPGNKLKEFVDRLRIVVDANTKVAGAISEGKG